MNRFEKWSVWSTSILTVATGVGYFVTKYLFTSPDPYSVVGHPWQPYFLKAHILVSPLLLFALGAITVHHVWDHYVSGVRWSRRSALLTALAVVPMVATGYLIQVFTDQGWVRAMAISHIVFGTLYGAGLLAHTLIIRRGRRRRAPSPGDEAGGERREGPGTGPEPRRRGVSGAPLGSGPAGSATPAPLRRRAAAGDGGDPGRPGPPAGEEGEGPGPDRPEDVRLKLSGAEIEE